LNEKTKTIEKLTEKCTTLQEELGLYEALKLANQAINSNNTSESVVNTLQRELERSLTSIKQKRNEIQKIQLDQQKYLDEIERLKRDLAAAAANNVHAKCDNCERLADGNLNGVSTTPYQLSLKSEIDRLNNLVDELQKEKIDITNDLNEKNSKLDLMFEQEEQFQQIKNNLELEIYSKQQHINDCEKLIDELHASSNQENIQMQFHQQQQQQQMILNEYEAQIAELKLKLTNREHEVNKKISKLHGLP
jgi:chromosome segregation ATPase